MRERVRAIIVADHFPEQFDRLVDVFRPVIALQERLATPRELRQFLRWRSPEQERQSCWPRCGLTDGPAIPAPDSC